ncbi:MAG: nucleotidyltransferase domain-containing protein [Phycisphaerae bacterium]
MKNKIIGIVRKYAKELKKNRVHINQLYLYGSQATGKHRAMSDIDIAVISDSLSGDWFEDMKLLRKVRRMVDLRIEPMPFRPERFNSSEPLYHQITSEGIKVV